MSLAIAVCALRLAITAPDEPTGEAMPPPAASASPAAPAPAAPAPVPLGESTGAIGQAFQAAESRQGALDGAWRLVDADGVVVYVVQLSDPGAGAPIEGAWRDPRRPGATESSGFLSRVSLDGETLELRFGDGLFAPKATLRPAADGGWTGELVHDGPRRAVAMSRY
jgi:hypothetical protein